MANEAADKEILSHLKLLEIRVDRILHKLGDMQQDARLQRTLDDAAAPLPPGGGVKAETERDAFGDRLLEVIEQERQIQRDQREAAYKRIEELERRVTALEKRSR